MFVAILSHGWHMTFGWTGPEYADFVADFWHPVRYLVFMAGFWPLAVAIGIDVYRQVQQERQENAKRWNWRASLVVFGIMGILVFPLLQPEFVVSSGLTGSVQTAAWLEGDTTYMRHIRVLKPFLGAMLELRAPMHYLIFSLGITYLHMVMTFRYLKLDSMKSWQIGLLVLSFATCSHLAYDFAYPGNDDQLFLLLAIMGLTLRLSTVSWIAIATFAMSTHQAGMLTVLPLGVLIAPKRLGPRMVGVFILYFAIWTLTFQQDSDGHLSGHRYSTLEKLMMDNDILLRGIGYTFRLMLLAIPIGWWLRRKDVPIWQHLAALLLILLPLGITIPLRPIPDTTRILGWGFLGMLFFLRQWQLGSENRPRWRLALYVVASLNLLIPVGLLFVGPVMRTDGLYHYVWKLWDSLKALVG